MNILHILMENAQADQSSYRILAFSESHPYVMLGAVIALVLVIIYMYIGDYKTKKKPKRQSLQEDIDSSDGEDESIDNLITDTDKKQRNNKNASL